MEPKYVSINGELVAYFTTGFCPLSNFHFSPFIHRGQRYTCIQQWYESEKAAYFNDWGARDEIMKERTARKHYQIGSQIEGYDEQVWAKMAENVMYYGLEAKFQQNEVARKTLLSTGDATIAFATPYDIFWGTGVGPEGLSSQWPGDNRLGRLLELVRQGLLNKRAYDRYPGMDDQKNGQDILLDSASQ